MMKCRVQCTVPATASGKKELVHTPENIVIKEEEMNKIQSHFILIGLRDTISICDCYTIITHTHA